MTLESLSMRVRDLYRLDEVPWETLARSVPAAHRIRLDGGALVYAGRLSLLARQEEGRYWVLCGYDPEDTRSQEALMGRQGALLEELEGLNARAEDEALRSLFVQEEVKVSFWDGWVAFEPKAYYPHTALEWGRLRTGPHRESPRLLDAALRFLRERGREGFMTLEDVERLAPR